MIRVNIVCVGGLKESYWREAVAEYAKRLSAFCRFDITEISECRLPDNPSPKQIDAALAREYAAMEKFLQQSSAYSIAMCIEGKSLSSEQLSQTLSALPSQGFSAVNFFIGSSYGLCEQLKNGCRLRLSMSPMTFPHQLARVMLCEQLYRAFAIAGGRKYHK